MFLLHRLAGAQLVLHRHQIDAIALPLLLLPARSTDPKLLQNAAVELLEFVFGALVNNDPIRAAADDLLHRHFPGAENAFPQQGHPQGTHHQGGEFTGFDVEGEPEHPAELPAGFGDHLAVDHPAVTLRIEAVAEGIGRIHQDHIPHLTDAVQRHPAGQTRQEAGQRVVTQSDGHHFAAVDVDDHLADDPQSPASVAGDHLRSHQLRAQPQAVAGHPGLGVVRGRGQTHRAIVT